MKRATNQGFESRPGQIWKESGRHCCKFCSCGTNLLPLCVFFKVSQQMIDYEITSMKSNMAAEMSD
jgi:hypothetical protein